MSGTILTEKLVLAAIELARPSAEAILAHSGATWGPKYVMGCVSCPEVSGGIITFRYGMLPDEWDPKWGPEKTAEDFLNFAEPKRQLAVRGNGPTSQIIHDAPWLLEAGNSLWAGGTACPGISVGVSGATGEADELIAELVLTMVIGLARMEAARRIAAHEMIIS